MRDANIGGEIGVGTLYAQNSTMNTFRNHSALMKKKFLKKKRKSKKCVLDDTSLCNSKEIIKAT